MLILIYHTVGWEKSKLIKKINISKIFQLIFFLFNNQNVSYLLSMSQCILFLWLFLQGSVQSKIMDNLFAAHQGIERLPFAAYEQHRVVNTKRYHCCTFCQAWIRIFLTLDTIFWGTKHIFIYKHNVIIQKFQIVITQKFPNIHFWFLA